MSVLDKNIYIHIIFRCAYQKFQNDLKYQRGPNAKYTFSVSEHSAPFLSKKTILVTDRSVTNRFFDTFHN